MGITRKLIFPALILTLAVLPVFKKISAEKDSAFLSRDEILVVDNGFEFKIRALGNSSEEILKNSGIDLDEKDLVFPAKPEKGHKIVILRATPITLNILGKKEKTSTFKTTVKEVLGDEKIVLSQNELINYNLKEEVYPRMEIKIWKKTKPTPASTSKPSLEVKPKIIPKIVPKPQSKPAPKSRPKLEIQKTGEMQVGAASWYSHFPGNYCASLKFPRGAKLLVTNLSNGKSVIVIVNDRGPFISGRVIDLEKNAFSQIASLSQGTARVRVERIR